MSKGRVRVVVVGSGMVGHRFCERFLEQADLARFQLIVVGEEKRPAYDRIHLSDLFGGRDPSELAMAEHARYEEQGALLHVGDRVSSIDRTERVVVTDAGYRQPYDHLVLACGSAPFVPPIPGIARPGVFVYRTVEDVDAIRSHAKDAKGAVVIGGGLLGLEAAKGAADLGLEVHVVEASDRLMARQVDEAGGRLLQAEIKSLGIHVHVGALTQEVIGAESSPDAEPGKLVGLRLADGHGGVRDIPADLLIVAAGIRPRDELARAAGLEFGERGGVVIDDALRTSDPAISAIGECALHRGVVHGLVAPGYSMAEALAAQLSGIDPEARFEGADASTKLKLLGIDVASFGDPFADTWTEPEGGAPNKTVIVHDEAAGLYQKLIVSADGERLLGGVLVGDCEPFGTLLDQTRRAIRPPARPIELLVGSGSSGATGPDAAAMDGAAQVCSCNDVSKCDIVAAIADGDLTTMAELKSTTRAGTGCGGCVPLVQKLLDAELAAAGKSVDTSLCEHFAYTRQELFWIVKLGRIESFDALIASHGKGSGCEVCRPAIASILAATWNQHIGDHANIQDTNDRFLANIQRGGTYSVIPRVPGGEITPEKLIVLGQVAEKYDLYCKITGGQRIDLLGARVEQLPLIWEELVSAGFESGHAYGKALRTVKSCVGASWCRFGVQDSTGFAIRIEERYRGLRAPHKLKSAVSGCIRECAEAQSKDFGIIATEQGWNLYLCGNGGSHPRHADLVATDLSDEAVIRAVDRFLIFYIQTAKPLQRTARWIEELEGGVEYLKQVIFDDCLGIGDQLEADMQQLVDSYACEWKAVVEDPRKRERFEHFAPSERNTESGGDPSLDFVRERGQRRPGDWVDTEPARTHTELPPEESWEWQQVARVADVPIDSGVAIRHGEQQIAVYNFASRGEWYATQNMCPHRKDMVLARGLLGSHGEEAKVACPLHKKTFSLQTGKGLADPNYCVQTFPAEARDGEVWLKLPPGGGTAAGPERGHSDSVEPA